MLESEVLKFFPEPVFKYKFEKAEFFNNELAQYIYNLQNKEVMDYLYYGFDGLEHKPDIDIRDEWNMLFGDEEK